MNPASPRVSAALLFLLVAGCSGGGDARGGEAAGSKVFDVVEKLRIDGYAHELVPVDTTVRVEVRDDGMIVIAQQQTNELRFFSADGEPLGRLGRRGEGPAEFMQLWRLGWMADTLYAYDFSLRRFTLIDDDLEYVRYIHVPSHARPSPELEGRLPEFSVVYGGALYADGSVYGEMAGPLTELATADFDPTMRTYGRIAEDGTILSYFQWRSTTSEPIEVPFNGRMAFAVADALPPLVRPVLGRNSTGTRIAHVQVAVEGPDAHTFEVMVEDIFAGELFRRRYPYEPRPITQEMRDSILDDRLSDSPPDFAAAIRRGAVFPPLLPPVVTVIIGRDDALWIRLADTAEGRPYRILDPMGEPLGTLMLPTNERIAVADLSLELIWVIQRDEFDVESVVRYGLVEGGD